MNKEEEIPYKRIAVILGGVGGLALLATGFSYWLKLHHLGISPQSDDWGTLGDFIGGIAGTVIALSTLIALVFTLELQARELSAARDVMGKQAFALKKQNFEYVVPNFRLHRRPRYPHARSANCEPNRGRSRLISRACGKPRRPKCRTHEGRIAHA